MLKVAVLFFLVLHSALSICSSFLNVPRFSPSFNMRHCNPFPSNMRVSKARFMMSTKSTDNSNYYAGKDAYQILGVSKGADSKAIKVAFRKLVSQWHPDKFPNDPAKKMEGNLRMEQINRAYYILSDDDRRRRYDQFGEQGVGSSAASEEQLKASGGSGMSDFFGGMGGDVDISDIFEQFFGSGGMKSGGGRGQKTKSANSPIAGDDIQVEVEVPFMTGIFGGQEKISVRRLEECTTCSGSGVKPGATVRTCSVCGGGGVVNTMQRTPFGVMSSTQPCSNCRGSGQEVEDYCPTCKGKGSNTEYKEVVLKIPAGIESGVNLRVKGAGNAGMRGGLRGDLFVRVEVKKDAKFRRDGSDIYSEEEISYVDAILGITIKADTVDGKMDVKVAAGTQPGQKLRVRGKGAPRLGTEVRGEAIITVKVKIPTNLSGKEKELIDQIAELPDKKKGFFGFG